MKPSLRKAGCVSTDSYVGPLGLLLELIEEKGLSINQISLAQVADQYWSYVEREQIDLRELADFLEIAAKLVWIKSKTLTGFMPVSEEGEEEDQEDLTQRLWLYAKFRDFGDQLAADFLKHSFGERGSKRRPTGIEQDGEIRLAKEDLKGAWEDILKRLPDSGILKKERVRARLEMKEIISLVKKRMSQTRKASFFGIAQGMNKGELILAFLAVLELAKKTEANLGQKGIWQDISITPL